MRCCLQRLGERFPDALFGGFRGEEYRDFGCFRHAALGRDLRFLRMYSRVAARCRPSFGQRSAWCRLRLFGHPRPDDRGTGRRNVSGRCFGDVAASLQSVVFSVTRKAENVTKVRINSVSLGRIAHSPASASLGSALPLGANDGSYVFPADAFVQGDQPYKYSGFDEVLPKSSAAFDLAMQVVFNDAGKPADLNAEIPAMAFAPGLRYTFDLSLQGGFIVLTLQVTPWNTDAVWDTAFGDPPYASVTVGTWEITGWTTDIGGHFVPQVDPASWSANHSLSPELGL